MSLTNTQIKNALPREKNYRLLDQKGLFLLIKPNGRKYWRFRYWFNGKERVIALGIYPDVTLDEARKSHMEAKLSLANKSDPRLSKKIIRDAGRSVSHVNFESVAREWHRLFSAQWRSVKNKEQVLRRLEKNIFPWLGNLPIYDIKASNLLKVLQAVQNRGAPEVAHRLLQTCGQIMRYAVATDRADRDFTSDLKGALPPVKKKHWPSIKDPAEVGKLLAAIEDYQGHFVTKYGERSSNRILEINYLIA